MFLILIFFCAIAGLSWETYGASHQLPWAENSVALAVWSVLLYFLWRPPTIHGKKVERLTLLSCLFLATAGELVMSALLQFYLYRQSMLPLFVPPGHVLLFLGGLETSRARWFRPKAVYSLVFLVLALLSFQLFRGQDFLSLLFLAAFLPALYWGQDRALYALMFLLALALELYGTYLGSWRWQPFVVGPGFELPSANPPLAAGGAYAVLDLLTLQLTLILGRFFRRSEGKPGF